MSFCFGVTTYNRFFRKAKNIGSNLNAKPKQLSIVLATHFATKQGACRAECIEAKESDYAAGAKSPRSNNFRKHPCGVLFLCDFRNLWTRCIYLQLNI